MMMQQDPAGAAVVDDHGLPAPSDLAMESPLPKGFVLNRDAEDPADDDAEDIDLDFGSSGEGGAGGTGGAGGAGGGAGGAGGEGGGGGSAASSEVDGEGEERPLGEGDQSDEEDDGPTSSIDNILPAGKIANGAKAAASLWSWGFGKVKEQAALASESFQETEIGKKTVAAHAAAKESASRRLSEFQETETGRRLSVGASVVKQKAGEGWEATKDGVATAYEKTKPVAVDFGAAVKEGTRTAGQAIKEGAETAYEKTKPVVLGAAAAVKEGTLTAYEKAQALAAGGEGGGAAAGGDDGKSGISMMVSISSSVRRGLTVGVGGGGVGIRSREMGVCVG